MMMMDEAKETESRGGRILLGRRKERQKRREGRAARNLAMDFEDETHTAGEATYLDHGAKVVERVPRSAHLDAAACSEHTVEDKTACWTCRNQGTHAST